ncbi:hypothetical protein ACP8HI_00405 [Paenibacillus sp. FA6]|uniref:hypothetical protein n=1 Tax=Paenibacillus sp. FA6 TaxID=3413029 RepID=UPI003F660A10
MDFSSSIAYRRFLNDFYNEFNTKYFNDVIDFLEVDEDHTFDQYLIETEVKLEIEAEFSYVLTAITKELDLMLLDSIDIEYKNDTQIKVYEAVVKMIKVKLRDFILDSSAYYHLSARIN